MSLLYARVYNSYIYGCCEPRFVGSLCSMDGSVSMALILLLSLAIPDKFYDVLRADYSTRKPLDVDTPLLSLDTVAPSD